LAWICQLESGATTVPPELGVNNDVIVAPFISHSANAPQTGAVEAPSEDVEIAGDRTLPCCNESAVGRDCDLWQRV